MKNYSPDIINYAAKQGKTISQITKNSLEKAYNFYRDSGKITTNSNNTKNIVLSICSADYSNFINNIEFKDWIIYNSDIKSYRKGLIGSMVGIIIFSDIFLEQDQRILRDNVLFLLPEPDSY